MKTLLLSLLLCLSTSMTVMAVSPDDAKRYLKEAEYYQRQADSYQSDADYYLRQAKSKSNDASYYIRQKNYDKAKQCARQAAEAMDKYQTKIESSLSSASKSEDYYRKAANALR